MPPKKPPEPRRIGLYLSESLAQSMRVLGLEPAPEPGSGREPDGATEITAVIHCYAGAVHAAGRELEQLLTREEWNYLADVLNGCADLWYYSTGPGIPAMTMILSNVADGNSLDGLGDKWFGDGKGNAGTKRFLEKLGKLCPIHGDAIMAAVRYFWDHTDIDHSEARWWSVAMRAPQKRERV